MRLHFEFEHSGQTITFSLSREKDEFEDDFFENFLHSVRSIMKGDKIVLKEVKREENVLNVYNPSICRVCGLYFKEMEGCHCYDVNCPKRGQL
jgi:hypothetical protein